MAFKFSKSDSQRLIDFRDELANARSDLDEVIAKETAVIEDAYSGMNVAIESYNEILAKARGFVEDIHSEAESEYDDKSENWQGGDRGEATREWIDLLADVVGDRLDDLELFVFEPPAMDFDDQSDILDNLPQEPEY